MKNVLFILTLTLSLNCAFAEELKSRISTVEQAAAPESQHQLLGSMVGQWRVKAKIWATPDSNPEVFSAKAEIRYILNKRFIKQNFKSKTLNKQYSMLSIIGYDKTINRYTSSWLSNYSTSINILYGDYQEQNKTITFSGSINDTVTAEEKNARVVIKLEGKKGFSVENLISSHEDKNNLRTVAKFHYLPVDDDI